MRSSVLLSGLDEAILGNMGGSDPEKDGKRITDLLKHGAHAIIGQDEAKARDEESFAKEDIDAILAGRTEKRQIGSRAGNTFSTATFAVQEAAVSWLLPVSCPPQCRNVMWALPAQHLKTVCRLIAAVACPSSQSTLLQLLARYIP